MRHIIDRFEGNVAVCEDEQRDIVNFPRSVLHDGAKEGDWFEYDGITFEFLPEDTEIARLMNLELQSILMGE